jgi:putative restriction endonuclease
MDRESTIVDLVSQLELPSLLRKAAVEAGFDLEPEVDGNWWRLRSSGSPVVAWLMPGANGGCWLALPTKEQLTVAHETGRPSKSKFDVAKYLGLPTGAAGVIPLLSAEVVHGALRRVLNGRERTAKQLAAQWKAKVAAALGSAGDENDSNSVSAPLSDVAVTEVIASVRRRVGQDLFREALLDFWEGRCAVSGLDVPELLRASHAKPWAEASDAERLDVNNGLLLAVHLDALFDRGFLTFDETGAGIFSSTLATDDRERLGLREAPPRLRRIYPDHHPYLAWHREHVFRP